KGIAMLVAAGRKQGLPVVSEITAAEQIPRFAAVDVLQVGARNMQNYELLKALAACRQPILLKRGWSATLQELLFSAEYLLAGGNPNVILCERGIRTYDTITRNTLDLAAVPLLKKLSHLPVIVDPSHGTGIRSLILPMSLAAAAAGADGLLLEMHPHPEQALSDGEQSLNTEEFRQLMAALTQLRSATGKRSGLADDQ
ncbi:MAG: N-acetylneuraminate synthase family protein, partial [Negativicutes bacterium]|nr:N-acetylneuraminate synthase family protein [Negativicutes bacterium]